MLKKAAYITCAITLCFAAHSAHAATTYYAAPADAGDGDCTAAPDACDLQQALDAAFTGDADAIIELSTGTYTSLSSFSFDHSEFAHSLTLHGADEDTVIVTATNNGLRVNAAGLVTVQEMTFSANGIFGLYSLGSGSTVVEDCTFKNHTDIGLYIAHNAATTGSATVAESTFIDNEGGDTGLGALLYANSSSGAYPITVEDSVFENNVSTDNDGGGLYLIAQADDSPMTVTGSTFNDNSASRFGGGLYAESTGDNSDIIIGGDGADGNTFDGNSAGLDGGGAWVVVSGDYAEITIEGNTFTNNTADNGAGGALYIDNNSPDVTATPVSVTDNVFGTTGEGNSANFGGGVFLYATDGLVFTDNEFVDNTAGTDGGGAVTVIDVDSAEDEFDNVILNNYFSGNSAEGSAGGLEVQMSSLGNLMIDANTFLENSAEIGEGGGMSFVQEETTENAVVTNNLFAGNTAGTKGGGFAYYGTASYGLNFINNTLADNTTLDGEGGNADFEMNNEDAGFHIGNNIFWDGEATGASGDANLVLDSWNTIEWTYNDADNVCVDGEASTCSPNNATASRFEYEHNLHVDPLFTDVDDFTLTAPSPLIDRGNSHLANSLETDIAGHDRIQDSAVDLGAYERESISNNLIAHWKLDDGAGELVEDSAGSNTGSVTGFPNWERKGRIDGAFEFDGETYILVARPVEDNFSICAWIKATGVGTGTNHWELAPIMDAEVPDIADDYGFGVDSNGNITYGNGGEYDSSINGTHYVADDEWHFACATRNTDNGDMKTYVDGELDASGTSSTSILDGNNDARIGYGYDGGGPAYFVGLMDDIRVYDIVLTAFDISALYENAPATDGHGSSSGGATAAAVQQFLQTQNALAAGSLLPPGSPQTLLDFTRLLKFGMTGDDVRALQVFLNTHGFVLASAGAGSPGNETNYFGMLTKAALIAFQKAHGLVPDGIAGPKTFAVINSL